MQRLLIIGACVLGICAGASAAFPFVHASQTRQQGVTSYSPPLLPPLTVVWGTVISADEQSSAITIEAVSPYAPSERVLLRVHASDGTNYSVVGAPEGGAQFSDLKPGNRVWLTLQREPGPLEVALLWIVE